MEEASLELQNHRVWELMNYGVMETVKNFLKGVCAFCSYVFVPQWGKNKKRSHIKIEAPISDGSLYGSMFNGLATSSKFHG